MEMNARRLRSAKIVSTLGPSSSAPDRIRALFEAGVDVFRLNFSHGTHEDHQARFAAIRSIESATGRPIGILADLQGPKLRLGTFAEGRIELGAGDCFRLDLDQQRGDQSRAPLPHPEIFDALCPGTELLVDDGKVRLRVENCGAGFADTLCLVGGTLSDRKGVNVPNAVLPLSAVTEKDRADLAFALEQGADWIAFSFVQRPDDVAEGRKLVAGRAGVMVKLEKPSAIQSLHEIIELADGLMVARGDLGVEMPPEDVPSVQKEIIHACRLAGKPVIVATQMLESMIGAPVPTRAEASDVATAIYHGSDAVMLSAESASGSYPVEAVKMMDRIITEVESDPHHRELLDASQTPAEPTTSDAICAAMRQVAEILRVAVTVAYTTSGSTSLRAARERPAALIVSMTPSLATVRRLALVWGVHSVHTRDVADVSEMVECACRTALEQSFAKAGDTIVITAGMPFGTPGATNLLR